MGLQAVWDKIRNKPSTFSPTLPIEQSDVNGLGEALVAKADADDLAMLSDGLTGLNDEIDTITPDTVANAIKGLDNSKALTALSSLRLSQVRNIVADLPRLSKSIRDVTNGTRVTYVRVGLWGDSVGKDFCNDKYQSSVYRELGWGGRWLPAATTNGTWYGLTASGAATYNTSDFQISPSGYSISISSSATLTFVASKLFLNSIPISSMLFDTATVCYAKESGAGTFKISTTNGVQDFNTFTDVQTGIDASNGSLAFGSATVAVPRAQGSQIRITHTSGGTIRIIGVLVTDSLTSGAVFIDMTQGGINVGQVNSNASTVVYDGLMAVLRPNVMFWSAKDELDVLQSHLSGMVTKLQTGWPYFDWCFVLPTPDDGDEFNEPENVKYEFVRDFAVGGGYALYDSREFIRSLNQSRLPIEPSRSLSSLSRSGTTATATLSSHGYEAGETVAIANASVANFNSTLARILTVTSSNFTYEVAASGATSATGATVQRTAGIYHDTAHLSVVGTDLWSHYVLGNSGLLGNSLAQEGRNINTRTINASEGIQFQGRSIIESGRLPTAEAWRTRRGLAVDIVGAYTESGNLTSVGTGDFTLSSHVLIRELETNLQFFKVQKTNTTGNVGSIQASRAASDQIRITLRDDANTASVSLSYDTLGIDSRIGEVIHVAIARRSGKVTLFLDGIPRPVTASTTGTPLLSDSIDTKFLRVNAGTDTSKNVFLETAWWPSGLTDAQVLSYHITKILPVTPQLLWRYRDNSGNRITDESGNGNHGSCAFRSNNNDPDFVWDASLGNGMIVATDNTTGLAKLNQRTVCNGTGSRQVFTLPTPSRVGDFVEIIGSGVSGWRVAQAVSHQIVEGAGTTVGTNATTAGTGGHLSSTNRYDSVLLRCVVNDAITPSYVWAVSSRSGSLAWV